MRRSFEDEKDRISDNKIEDVLVEGLKNDVFDTIFSFFKPSQLQVFRLVRRSWNAYIPEIQRRNMHPELQWYVSNSLLSLGTAIFIDELWQTKVEERWALIPSSIREAIERLNMSNPYREFLVKDYPLLALIGRFISVDECKAMPIITDDPSDYIYELFPHIRPVSGHLKELVDDPWGVRMLAKKLISPTQAAIFESSDVLHYFISESGLILLEERFFTIDQLMALSTDEDAVRLKHLCSTFGIATVKQENLSFEDIIHMDLPAFILLRQLTLEQSRASVDPTVNTDYYSINPS